MQLRRGVRLEGLAGRVRGAETAEEGEQERIGKDGKNRSTKDEIAWVGGQQA